LSIVVIAIAQLNVGPTSGVHQRPAQDRSDGRLVQRVVMPS
jgi:hypothetical protein